MTFSCDFETTPESMADAIVMLRRELETPPSFRLPVTIVPPWLYLALHVHEATDLTYAQRSAALSRIEFARERRRPLPGPADLLAWARGLAT